MDHHDRSYQVRCLISPKGRAKEGFRRRNSLITLGSLTRALSDLLTLPDDPISTYVLWYPGQAKEKAWGGAEREPAETRDERHRAPRRLPRYPAQKEEPGSMPRPSGRAWVQESIENNRVGGGSETVNCEKPDTECMYLLQPEKKKRPPRPASSKARIPFSARPEMEMEII